MRGRLVWLALAAAAPLAAQFGFFTTAPERPVEAQLDLGTAPAGDMLETRLRVRNLGSAPAPLGVLTVAGAGFALTDSPALPRTLAAGEALDFTVRFRAAAFGSYSAVLRAEGMSIILRAAAVSALTLLLDEAGLLTPLDSGAAVEFGAAERGARVTRRFVLENRSGQTLPVPAVTAGGSGFRMAGAPAAGARLAPRESAAFEVHFEPAAAQKYEGTLNAGSRQVTLRGAGLELPLPVPVIVLEGGAGSQQQGRLTVRFATTSRTRGTGTVRLEFRPNVPLGGADPAVLFSNGTRTAEFTAAEGDAAGQFGGRGFLEFQTGATAGELVFTAQLGTATARASLLIAPAPAGIARVRAARAAGGVEVRVTGFDNTRTASSLGFTFYDRAGAAVPPGLIRADAAAAFRGYFESTDAGGVFEMRAVFPVTGGTEQLAEVEVELTNTTGTARGGRVRIE